MDCKEPNFDLFNEFVMCQTRYSQLPKVNPDHAEELLEKSCNDAKKRYKAILRMAE